MKMTAWFCLAVLWVQGPGVQAYVPPTPTPTFTIPPEPPSYPSAVPTPYPALTPPPLASERLVINTDTLEIVTVGPGESIQAAVNAARTKDVLIQLNADSFQESVTVTSQTLYFAASPGRSVTWIGRNAFAPDDFGFDGMAKPALTIDKSDVVILRINMTGGNGYSYNPTDTYSTAGHPGGNGSPAILINQSRLNLIEVHAKGGNGGRGGHDDFLPMYTAYPGGDGAPALHGGMNVYADLGCRFNGGEAGQSPSTSPMLNPIWPDVPPSWVLPAPHGKAAPPLELDPDASFRWVSTSDLWIPVGLSEFAVD